MFYLFLFITVFACGVLLKVSNLPYALILFYILAVIIRPLILRASWKFYLVMVPLIVITGSVGGMLFSSWLLK